jgi:hypothetical protein
MLSLIILGWQQVHAAFGRLSVRLFPFLAHGWTYFPVDFLA